MKSSVRKQISVIMGHSAKVKRSERKRGGSRRKGRDVGVLSKANGYRP